MPRDGPPPLSMNQDHIWHLDQMMPNTHFFNMPYCYHLKGTLNVEALERAVTELVRRHEALRTIFREVAGSPVQIVEEVSRILLQTIDLRLRSPDEASYAAAEFVLQERSTSFDLSVGPLCRVKLLRLTDTEAFLLVTVHHAISDHWSMQVFYSELIRFYESFQSGSPAALPEPKIQFGHYALWERRMLDTGQFNEQANYWKNQLTESCAGRQLHTEIGITRPLVAEFARQPIDINEHLLRDIRDFASKQYCTPFMVVLSAVFVMARFILAEPRIRVATLMANRRRLGAETAIGHFVNTIIITSSVSPGDTFVQLVRRIRRRLLAAYERQEFPFEQLACDIEKEHGFGRHLLAPVLFNYRKRAVTPISMAGLIFAPCVFPTTVSDSELLPAAYDLIFDVRETSTELTGTVNVSASIAGQEGAKGEASNLGNILDVLVAEPTRTLSTLILEVPKRPIY
jgi:hypothetical protein